MQENQNTNGQPQTKEVLPEDTQAGNQLVTPEIQTPSSAGIKEETPTPSTQSQTSNIEPQTDSMEVHKHPHHVMHKKKWTEYLLEFFMLFLAVFLGFVAENIRELQTENKRGEEYIKSFTEDLEKDTAQYTRLITELAYQDSVTNNIFDCYHNISSDPASANCLENITHNLIGFTDFVYTDRTIQQLKNAGGLRLIKDKNIADSIISYDAVVRTELIHQEGLEIYQQKTIDAAKAIIDFQSFSDIYSNGASKPASIGLLQNNRQAIDSYFNNLWVFKANLRSQIVTLRRLKTKAASLIAFLK